MSGRLSEQETDAMLIELLGRARNGDEAALNQLLDLLSRFIRQCARNYLRAKAELLRRDYGSDDFQQLALVDLADQIQNGKVRANSCGPFLRFVDTLVQRKVSREARKQYAEQRDVRRTVSLATAPEPASDGDQDPEQLAMTKEVIAVARQHLRADERQICELYLEHIPWRAIAARVGGTENAVRHKWRSALSRIRRHFGITPPPTSVPANTGDDDGDANRFVARPLMIPVDDTETRNRFLVRWLLR